MPNVSQSIRLNSRYSARLTRLWSSDSGLAWPGAASGASAQANRGGNSISAGLPVPKIGAGAGAYAGVGAGYDVTAATGGCQ